MTAPERRAALDAIAAEVRACTACQLHAGRANAVPGEGDPMTEVVLVGEGPGVNEDRLGRPFVGRAGDLLVRLLASIGWQRGDVFITDEVAACAPYLRRQLEVLDPALVVTLGRHSMGRFMPGTTISRAHGTVADVDPATGAGHARVFAMYHPAAALRAAAVETATFADVARIPAALVEARELRERRAMAPAGVTTPSAAGSANPDADGADRLHAESHDAPQRQPDIDQLTLFT